MLDISHPYVKQEILAGLMKCFAEVQVISREEARMRLQQYGCKRDIYFTLKYAEQNARALRLIFDETRIGFIK